RRVSASGHVAEEPDRIEKVPRLPRLRGRNDGQIDVLELYLREAEHALSLKLLRRLQFEGDRLERIGAQSPAARDVHRTARLSRRRRETWNLVVGDVEGHRDSGESPQAIVSAAEGYGYQEDQRRAEQRSHRAFSSNTNRRQ